MLVSIIVTTYNCEEYLRQCMDSCCNQTYDDIEVICIDNCSSDKSLEILEEYAMCDSRISVCELGYNSGVGGSKNAGIRRAQGEYLMFLDGDDYLESNAVERLVQVARKYNTDFVSFDYRYFSDDNNPRWNGFAKRNKSYPDVMTGHQLMLEEYGNNDYRVGACQFFYGRSFLLTNNIFFKEGLISEDLLFAFEVHLKAERVRVIEDMLYNYRQHDKSVRNNGENARKHLRSLWTVYGCCVELYETGGSDISPRVIDCQLDTIGLLFSEFMEKMDLESVRQLHESSEDIHFRSYIRNQWRMLKNETGTGFSDEDMRILSTSSKICIFGNGKYFRSIMPLINRYELNVDAILVSGASGGHRCGYPIVNADEYLADNSHDVAVILAVTDNYKQDIRDLLGRYENVRVVERQRIWKV